MAISKPSKLPIWDINATNIVEPQTTNQSDGWQVDANGIPQKPPFQYHNYMWHTQYKWLEYLDAEKALIQGDSTKTFKIAPATLADEAIAFGQLVNTTALTGSNVELVQGRKPVGLAEGLGSSNIYINQIGGSWIKNQCTAFVVFNGVDGTIKDSFNVTSVIHNATGNATINFMTAMANINYGGWAETNREAIAAGSPVRIANVDSSTKTVGSVNVRYGYLSTSAAVVFSDEAEIRVIFFGGK